LLIIHIKAVKNSVVEKKGLSITLWWKGWVFPSPCGGKEGSFHHLVVERKGLSITLWWKGRVFPAPVLVLEMVNV
jgi:hypothetical protein